MIDPRALRTFHAVCEAGSISGAARALNISQPAVSNAIAQLEARLGARLFERSRLGINLTVEGLALKRRGIMLENLLTQAQAEVAAASVGIAGPLHVGGTPGALVSLLPSAIGRLDENHERFALHVIERSDPELTDLLRKCAIELAFVTTELESPPSDIAETTLSRDPFALIVGREYDSLPDEVSLRDVGHFPWVLPEAQGAFRRQVDALFLAAGVAAPHSAIRCDSLLTTKALVRTSDRITILPEQVAAAELSTGVLRAVAISEATFERSVGVRQLAGAKLSPLAQTLMGRLLLQP